MSPVERPPQRTFGDRISQPAQAEEAPGGRYAARLTPGAAVALTGAANLLLYGLLLVSLRHLGTVEPSFAGEVFPWVERLTREAIERRHAAASLQFLGLVAGLFALYGVTVRLVGGRSSPSLELRLFVAGALFLLLMTSSAVMLSTDVYAYTMYGRIFAVYHGDPYVKLEPPYPDDPFLPLSYFLPWPSWYGPLWTLVSAGVALVAGERVGLTVLLFRLIAIGGALAATALIWAILRRRSPERAAQGIVLFLWNPLVVLECGLSGHNDAVMAALVLGGVWLATRGARVRAVVPLALSAMVKLVGLMVLPLYAVFALRQLRSPREWPGFLAPAGALGLATVGAFLLTVGGGTRLPVAQSASAAYFYDNNVYQILFPALRLWLGEDAESVKVPVHFYPWWGEARRPSVLESAPNPGARDVEQVKAGTKLLVTAPLEQGWVKVYNPQSKRHAYVQETGLEKIDRPESANADPAVGGLERNPANGPIATRANRLIRSATWALFAVFLLLAAWRVRDEQSWLVWSGAVLLAAYWLVATEIWPWYVIWSLALAALVPDSRVARLAVILSASVLTLYVTIGFERSAHAWLFTYRSLPAFALPLVLFGGWELWSRLHLPRRVGSRVVRTLERARAGI